MSSPRARLFVALDLPADARRRLAELVPDRPDLRPVPVQALHVTLVFIGHRPEEEIPAIASAVQRAAGGLPATALRPLGVVPVPRRGPPRLFALDLDDEGGRAAAVQSAVSRALEPWHQPEERPFWPHVTVARVRRGKRAAPLAASAPDERFEATEVTLYRSRLSPRGASYEPLTRISLA
jgi:RNA 2',3'-cyclic 3'-phosphodiesterase